MSFKFMGLQYDLTSTEHLQERSLSVCVPADPFMSPGLVVISLPDDSASKGCLFIISRNQFHGRQTLGALAYQRCGQFFWGQTDRIVFMKRLCSHM